MFLFARIVCAASMVLFVWTVPSFAASTGWIDANELSKFHRRVLRKGYIPTSMRCKNAYNVIQQSRKNVMVNVQYRRNVDNKKRHWAWGTSVPPLQRRLKKRGFKQVSYRSYRRESGLKVACAVWHK